MNNPLISTIVPVYNSEKYLTKCLKSVINQTLGNDKLEIIIVNDGSTDNSLQIINRFKDEHTNIILIDQKNMGLGAARNNGMKAATGEYIAFLDSDDYLPEDAYEKLLNAANESGAEIAVGKLSYIFEGDIKWVTRLEELFVNNERSILIEDKTDKRFLELIRHCHVVHKICKRSFILERNILFPENLFHEDIPFTTPLYLLARNIIVINDVVYYYYLQEKSILRNVINKKKLYIDIFKILEITYNVINQQGLGEYKYILDLTAINSYFPQNDRIEECLSRICIKEYELTWDEFIYISSIASNIIDNVDQKAILHMDAQNVRYYKRLCKLVRTNRKRNYNNGVGASYKLNRSIYILKRKAFSGLRCIRNNGLRYTIKLACDMVKKN